MIYVALLRSINVGGKNRVEMARLKAIFEKLSFSSVKTYINSGNVVFAASLKDQQKLAGQIEEALEGDFGFKVKVLLRNLDEVEKLVKAIPKDWVNDQTTKCDVMFLWKEVDKPEVVKQLPHNPKIEDVKYFPGTVVWRIDRDKVTKGRMVRIVGTDLHKKMTIRNPNTVRKLYELMLDAKN